MLPKTLEIIVQRLMMLSIVEIKNNHPDLALEHFSFFRN
jgi:hypothetical protein